MVAKTFFLKFLLPLFPFYFLCENGIEPVSCSTSYWQLASIGFLFCCKSYVGWLCGIEHISSAGYASQPVYWVHLTRTASACLNLQAPAQYGWKGNGDPTRYFRIIFMGTDLREINKNLRNSQNLIPVKINSVKM